MSTRERDLLSIVSEGLAEALQIEFPRHLVDLKLFHSDMEINERGDQITVIDPASTDSKGGVWGEWFAHVLIYPDGIDVSGLYHDPDSSEMLQLDDPQLVDQVIDKTRLVLNKARNASRATIYRPQGR